MNKTKISNPVRLIAFFLTAVILVCTFGFTVDGWHRTNGNVSSLPNDKNNEDNNDIQTGNKPEQDLPENPDSYIPEFTNRLTGLETSEEISKSATLAFIMESDNCYGISRSDLLVEIPTENGKTRLISFITDRSELWKVGSITSGRGYITNLAKYFGAIALYNGNDDKLSYKSCDTSGYAIDLSLKDGFYYTEFSSKVYTNCDLVSSGLSAYGIKNVSVNNTLPFAFNGFNKDIIQFKKANDKVQIMLDDGAIVDLNYDKEKGNYYYSKNGTPKTDLLNGKTVEFTNCFILFADSITYDKFECSQMVMDTIGSGTGYYITEGTYTTIKWIATENGVMSFYLSTGERLTVNRGNSYICYLKSSKTDSVIFI